MSEAKEVIFLEFIDIINDDNADIKKKEKLCKELFEKGIDTVKEIEKVNQSKERLEVLLGERVDDNNKNSWLLQLFIDNSISLNFGFEYQNQFKQLNRKITFKDNEFVNFIRSKIHLQMGVLLEDVFKQRTLAEREYKKSIKLDEKSLSSRYRLFLLSRSRTRNISEYRKELDKIFDSVNEDEKGTQSSFYESLGTTFYNDYLDYIGARLAFERQIQVDNKNPYAHYNLGVVLRDKFGDKDAGDQEIQKAMELDSDFIFELCHEYESRISDNPDNASEMYELGVLYKYYLNEKTKGQALIDKSLDLDPDYLQTDLSRLQL